MSQDPTTKRKEFEELFLEQYQNLLSLGISVCGQKEFTKDTIQLFFLELWEKEIWTAEIKDSKAYLFKSFYRKLFSELKKSRKVDNASLDQLEENGVRFSSEQADSVDQLIELQERVKKALNDLPDKQQQMIRLKYQGGLEYEEIAEYTGKSRQTIYNQIHSSIKKLRARLAENSFPLKKK